MKFFLSNKKKFIEQFNLWMPLFFAIPLMIVDLVMIFSNTMVSIGFFWYSFVASGITIFWFGRDFYIHSFKEIFFKRTVGMSTLVTISSLLAFFYSTYILIDSTIHNIVDFKTFFDIGATIIAIVCLGEFVSDKIQERSSKDIDKIFTLQVLKSFKLDNVTKKFIEVDTKTLQINDLIQVRKGEKIPIDGIISDNSTEVDESLLTGEVLPIIKNKNDKVIGGSINVGNAFVLKVTSAYNDTVLQKIINSVKNIDDTKIKAIRIVDKVSLWFTPIVLICAILAFLLNYFYPNFSEMFGSSGIFGNPDFFKGFQDWQRGLYFFIATITIACPCALGIAAPLATFVGVSKGAKNGIIFNNADSFEKIKKINLVAFDKTGTLTNGKLNVEEFIGDKKNLPIIMKLESISFHPLAKSFINYCELNKVESIEKNINPKEIIGVGIEDVKNDYLVSSLDYAINKNFKINSKIKDQIEKIKNNHLNSEKMQIIIVFSKNKVIENAILFEDKIRPDALKTIQALQKRKIEVCMITGDSKKNAEYVTKLLNINSFYAEVKPNEKAEIIKKLQSEGKKVAYVGDGINDLIALKQADLSFSMTTDNEAAKSVSDINLLDLNISNIYKTITLTRQTRLGIFANLWWAFGYNFLVIPLAVLGFIPPIFSVFIMMTSDITVSANSLFLKFKKIKTIE